MNSAFYNEIVQMYYSMKRDREELAFERTKIQTKIDSLDAKIMQVKNILCRHGEFIDERFVEDRKEDE